MRSIDRLPNEAPAPVCVAAGTEWYTVLHIAARRCDERRTAGHPENGARLLRLWQLSEDLEIPVRCQHEPAASTTHSRGAAVTYMANRLSHRYGSDARPGRPHS